MANSPESSSAKAPFFSIQPPIGLPLIGIGAVAFETDIGKDRADVAIEIDFWFGGRHLRANRQAAASHENNPKSNTGEIVHGRIQFRWCKASNRAYHATFCGRPGSGGRQVGSDFLGRDVVGRSSAVLAIIINGG